MEEDAKCKRYNDDCCNKTEEVNAAFDDKINMIMSTSDGPVLLLLAASVLVQE
jgi:hypothetical protein